MNLAQSPKACKQMGYKFRWVLFQSLVFVPFHSAVMCKPGGNEVRDLGPWRGGAHMALPVSEHVSWEGCQQTPGQPLLIYRILPAMYVRRKEIVLEWDGQMRLPISLEPNCMSQKGMPFFKLVEEKTAHLIPALSTCEPWMLRADKRNIFMLPRWVQILVPGTCLMRMLSGRVFGVSEEGKHRWRAVRWQVPTKEERF